MSFLTALAFAASLFTLRVTPLVSFAPTTLTITVRSAPNPDARALVVVADGEEYFRSSVIPLDGEHAPITNRIVWRDVPAGEYAISAQLLGTSRMLNSSVQYVQVESNR